jgi:N-acetylglucosaminyl-diphospho-decaprenol L-rhamnosyltransferase
MQTLDVTAIIVSYNTEWLLRDAISRLLAAAKEVSVKIVVVDNASQDNSAALIRREWPGCHLIVNETNVGFGRANNQALGLIEGRYVLLLNPDAFVSPDTIRKTVAYMEAHPTCGILGVKLVGPDGALQPSCRFFPTPWNLFLQRTGLKSFFPRARLVDDLAWNHASVRQCDWVPGCFYLVRKQVIDEIGLFDPRYFLYYEEIDHCLTAKRAGWEVVFFPDTTVMHIGGESAQSEGEVTRSGSQIEALKIESELLYFRKNHGVVAVWMHVLLTTLADGISVVRRLVSRKLPAARTHAKRATLLWSLFVRTGWGMRPTR